MANLSQDLNLDIFNDWEDTTEQSFDAEAPAEELETTPEATEETTEDVVEETPAEEAPAEATEDVQWAAEEVVDIDQLVADILGGADEIDDKVEDIKDEAQSSGNEELLGMIDELQTLLAEKNQKIEELTKKNDITSGRLMDTYGDAENYSFYKPSIEKLENNPLLLMLVKNYDSDNEKAQERVVSILADLISEKTWEDVSSLINTNQKYSVSNALTDVNWGWEAWVPEEEDNEVFNRDQSLTELF